VNSLIAISGTPGSGKTRLSSLVKKACSCAKIIEINDVLNSYGAFSGVDESGAKIADLAKLGRAVRREISYYRNAPCPVVLVGHLAPELPLKYDAAIIVRSKLTELEKRLMKRGYSKRKISENLISEALDYCGTSMHGKCKELYEVEMKEQLLAAVSMISAMCGGKHTSHMQLRKKLTPLPEYIDKMGELYDMIKAGRILQ
jgi:adenylate kinase